MLTYLAQLEWFFNPQYLDYIHSSLNLQLRIRIPGRISTALLDFLNLQVSPIVKTKEIPEGEAFKMVEGEWPLAPQFRLFFPMLQISLVLFAICVSVLRMWEFQLLGLPLQGCVIPPQCILYCGVLGLVAIQQFGWEMQLLGVQDSTLGCTRRKENAE